MDGGFSEIMYYWSRLFSQYYVIFPWEVPYAIELVRVYSSFLRSVKEFTGVVAGTDGLDASKAHCMVTFVSPRDRRAHDGRPVCVCYEERCRNPVFHLVSGYLNKSLVTDSDAF